jgi:hypothetical protein
MYGGAARPTSPLDTIIRSTSTRFVVFQWVSHHDVILTLFLAFFISM